MPQDPDGIDSIFQNLDVDKDGVLDENELKVRSCIYSSSGCTSGDCIREKPLTLNLVLAESVKSSGLAPNRQLCARYSSSV